MQCIDLQIIIAKNVGFPLLTAFDKSAFIANKKISIVDLIECSTVLDKFIILRLVVPNDDWLF